MARLLALKPESEAMLTFDALRFLAAMGIVVQHSNAFLYPPETRIAMKEASWGLALFVDLFFVISGFVIAYVYAGRIRSFSQFGNFMQKRFARLFPLHILTFLAFFIAYVGARQIGISIGTPPDMSASCLLKTAMMLHAITPCEGSSLNPVSWSISAEMFLYVLSPLLLLLICVQRWVAIVALLTSAGIALVMAGDSTARQWTELYAPLRALPSFSFGVALYYALKDQKAVGEGMIPMIWLATSLLFAALVYGMTNGMKALPLMAIIYALCVCCALLDKSLPKHKLLITMAGFGKLTYAIYMIHLLVVIVLVNILAGKILALSYWPMLGVIIITCLVVILLSVAVYMLIERPARRWLSPALQMPGRNQ